MLERILAGERTPRMDRLMALCVFVLRAQQVVICSTGYKFHRRQARDHLQCMASRSTVFFMRSIWKVDKDTGKSVLQITPLSSTSAVAANSFVSGPLTADASGNIYYNTLWLADPAVTDPWSTSDVL